MQHIIPTSSQVQELNDGRSADKNAIRVITQNWVDMQMRQKEGEYLRAVDCSMFCGTWNVNAKKQEVGLAEWILPPGQPPADIYAIGFQEIVDLNVMNVGLNSANTVQKAEFWQKALTETLGSTGAHYQIVAEKYLVGVLLVVFAKEPLMPFISDVRSTTVAVGIMGVMGNKGGALVRFSLYDSAVCIVCAHLAAHRENVAGRNSDFKTIYEKALFPTAYREDTGAGDSGGIVLRSQGAARHVDKDLITGKHDLVFWIGDLNYRIDDSYSTEEVFAKIEAGDLEALRVKDQLNIERRARRAFQGFEEGVLTFAPTYKYQPGTDGYDRRPEKKLRAPAWCDRVLWKKLSDKEEVVLQDYRRANLLPSDHKPVSSRFQLTLRRVVASSEQTVFQGLQTQLSKFNSKAPPTVEVVGLKMNFGRVMYEEEKVAVVEIRNTGESVVYWRCVPKLDEAVLSKRWLRLDRTNGLLLPGESSRIEVRVQVDKCTAQQLNAGKDSLQDTIVLRVEKSTDQFIEVQGEYVRSCFGMSMEELVTITDPVSSLPLLQTFPEAHLRAPQTAETNRLSIPKEIWRLIDALWSGNALKEKGLFNSPADPLEVAAVRQALDEGLDFGPSTTPHDIVACLLGLLSALPRPLLALSLYPTTKLEAAALPIFARKFLEDLPPLNYNVFVYLISFFREVLAEESYNRCSASHLAEVCVSCMTTNIYEVEDASGVDGAPSGASAASAGAGAAGSTSAATAAATATSGASARDSQDVSVQSKEERVRRLQRQGFLYDVIEYLLTTPNL